MSESYEASLIKRNRATRTEVEARRSALYDIVAEMRRGHPMIPEKILRLPAVKEVTGLARSTIYKLMAANRFPAAVPLAPGCRAVGWRASDIAKHQRGTARAAPKPKRGRRRT